MKRKIIFSASIIFLFLVSVGSSSEYKTVFYINLNIIDDWKVNVLDYSVLKIDYISSETDYNLTNPDIITAIIAAKDGSVLASTKFNPSFLVLSDNPYIANETTQTLYLEYSDQAKEFKLEQHGKTILTLDLSGLCNHDSVCNNKENYLSCPPDCKSYEKDGYCSYKMDGNCDLDCPKNVDWDCRTFVGSEFQEQKPDNQNNLLLYIVLALIAILIIVLVLRKFKSKR